MSTVSYSCACCVGPTLQSCCSITSLPPPLAPLFAPPCPPGGVPPQIGQECLLHDQYCHLCISTRHAPARKLQVHGQVTVLFVAMQDQICAALLARLKILSVCRQEGEHFLGRFSQQTTAVRACDVASLKMHGAAAATHFPARSACPLHHLHQ